MIKTLSNGLKYNVELLTVNNWQSLDRTLSEMKIMENTSLKDPQFIEFVDNTFTDLKSDVEKIFKVHSWVNKNIIYQDDPYDETIISPRVLIYTRHGDCDDFAMLIKTILARLNVKTYYILLAKKEKEFSHIAVVHPIKGNNYIYIDGTMMDSKYPEQYKFYQVIK